MWYAFLADLVAAIHVAVAVFVILGELLILIGLPCHWGWVRNFWFRLAHLAGMGAVVLVDISGIGCPLTIWEDRLRRLAAQRVEEGSFVGRGLHNLLAYNFEPWVFTVCYLAFAVVVVATFVVSPPRRGKQQPQNRLGAAEASPAALVR